MKDLGFSEYPIEDSSDSLRTSKIANVASYLGAVTSIFSGYSTAYIMTAVELTDRRLNQNIVPDKLSVTTAACGLAVGAMGSAVLRLLNRRQ